MDNSSPIIIYNQVYNDKFFNALLKYFDIQQLSKKKYIYWCEISGDPNKYPSDDFYKGDFVKYFESEHLDAIKKGKAKLVISTCQETISPTSNYPIPEYVDVDILIEKECVRNNIPLENVIWISGDLKVKNRAKGNIKTFGYSCYSHEFDYLLTALSGDFFNNIVPFNERKFEKDFLCFQRWMKPGRIHLLNLLYQENLLDRGYISCPDKMFNDTFEKRSNMYLNRIDKYSSYLSKQHIDADNIKKNLEYLKTIVPMNLDVTDFESNFCAGLDTLLSSKKYYESSFCSVISEAQIEGDALYISEAAYRPFLYGHPAIWVAQPGIIQGLKNMGYQTWDWLLDESYDNEEYMFDRISMCVESLKKLLQKNRDKKILEKIHEQNVYNRNTMKNLSKISQKLKLLAILNFEHN